MKKTNSLIPPLRFKGFYGDWEKSIIENILNYEQPTKYIVKTENYLYDKKITPVLTAGKSFILGYTDEKNNIYNKGEVIILDDFTIDFRYVNFDFKIKSSAIKLLTSEKENLFFIYNSLKSKKINPLGHNRHYINFIQKINIFIPSILEQQKIAKFFSLLDKQIELWERKLMLSEPAFKMRN